MISVDLENNKTPSNYNDLFDLVSHLSNKNKVRYATKNVMIFESFKNQSSIESSVRKSLDHLKNIKEISDYVFVFCKISSLNFRSEEADFLNKIASDHNL